MKKQTFIAVAALLALASPAMADLFGFENITNNNAGDAAIGEAQLFVDVTAEGANQVRFTFQNTGPEASAIAGIYFDDGGLFSGIASISNVPGVNFAENGAPPVLPGGVGPPVNFQVDFRLNATPPPPLNGINPNEQLSVILNLLAGQTFADTLAALQSGSLRVGLHVIAFDSGGSESFVNTTGVIPAPGALGLVLIGLGLISRIRSRAV
jgi:hypothetical protein